MAQQKKSKKKTASKPASKKKSPSKKKPVKAVKVEPQPIESVAAPKQKPTWLFGAIVAGILIITAGSAYAYFGVYMQKPENIWKTSLSNTRQGLRAIAAKKYVAKKGAKIEGTIKVAMPLAADATISGATYEQASKTTVNATIAGLRVNLETRTIPARASAPDVYVYPSGFSGFVPFLSSNPNMAALVASLDGKWLSVDHATIGQLFTKAGFTALPSTSGQDAKKTQDTAKKSVAVINKYVLGDDDKAVMTLKESLAKEDFKGRKSQHLRVQIQKTQLHNFAVEMKDTLKDSPVKEWLVGKGSSQSFEKAINFDGLLKRIDATNSSKALADVWVDLGYKTIRAIRFYDDPADKQSYTELFFDYKGGDEYPVALDVVATNTAGSQHLSVGLALNRKSDAVKLSFSGTAANEKGKQTANASASVTLTPTNEKVSVERPANPLNLSSLLSGVLGQVQGASTLKVVNPSNASFLDTAQQ